MASFLRTGTPEQQSIAIFHLIDSHDGPEMDQRWTREEIAPELGTFHTSWHMVDMGLALKLKKNKQKNPHLEKSLPPVGLWEHSTMSKFSPQEKPLVLRLFVVNSC